MPVRQPSFYETTEECKNTGTNIKRHRVINRGRKWHYPKLSFSFEYRLMSTSLLLLFPAFFQQDLWVYWYHRRKISLINYFPVHPMHGCSLPIIVCLFWWYWSVELFHARDQHFFSIIFFSKKIPWLGLSNDVLSDWIGLKLDFWWIFEMGSQFSKPIFHYFWVKKSKIKFFRNIFLS